MIAIPAHHDKRPHRPYNDSMALDAHSAVIGAGRWGQNIIRTLSEMNCLKTIGHQGREQTAIFLRETHPSIQHTTDIASILHDSTITHICIATPLNTHGSLVREALQANKHVFVEKPLSLSLEEIDALYQLAAEKGKTLFVGYIYIYDPAFLVLKEALRDVSICAVETVWTKYGTFDSPLSENLLVHEIALAHELLGMLEVQKITRSEENVFEGTLVGEKGTAHIFIDRECEEKKKILTVRTDTTLYTMTIGKLVAQDLATNEEKSLHENTGAQLLEIELKNFLEETKNGAATNSKRRSMDCSIATISHALKRRPQL